MKKLFLLLLTILFLQFTLFSSTQAQPSFPFFDDIEDSATTYSNWDRDPDFWDIKITNAHSGLQVWAMVSSGNEWKFLTTASAVDLSSAPNPYISFWAKRESGNGYVDVEVSDNGGTSWTQLSQSWITDTHYQRFQFSLYNYRQANILVRIGCHTGYGSTYLIDDILMDNAPTPQYLIQTNYTNNGMELKWGQSTASDFYKYKIVLSTNNTKINFAATSYISGREEVKAFEIFSKTNLDTVLTDLAFTNTKYYGKIYEQDSQDLINQGSDEVNSSTA